MIRIGKIDAIAAALLLAAVPQRLFAQDEAHLRQAFEGRRVTVQIDMPATADGVDIYPGASRPIDFDKYSGRLRTSGTAYKAGESALITKVRVKGDLIEIQLGGGGYGTFGDALTSTFSNKGADQGTAQQEKIANERSQALGAGSRFNLRFQNGATPSDFMVNAVLEDLSQYITFASPVSAEPPVAQLATTPPTAAHTDGDDSIPAKGMTLDSIQARWGSPASTTTNGPIATSRYTYGSVTFDVDLYNGVAVDVRRVAAGATLRKGMKASDVEAISGKALSSSTTGQVTTNKYRWEDGTLEADFVNGILVAYRISSN